MDYIYFFYGLSFLVLGAVCIILKKTETPPAPWYLLGLFGLVHGVNEWLDLLALSFGDNEVFLIVRLSVIAPSYIFLFEFARIGMQNQCAVSPAKRKTLGLWIYLPFLLLTSLGFAHGLDGLKATVRYFLGLPAGIFAAWVIWRFAGFERSVEKRRALFVLSVAVGVYGVATGAVVPGADFPPACWINYDTFSRFLKFPVQLLRAFSALLAAVAVLYYSHCEERREEEKYPTGFNLYVWIGLILIFIIGCGWIFTDYLGDYSKKEALRYSAPETAEEVYRLIGIGITLVVFVFASGILILAKQVIELRRAEYFLKKAYNDLKEMQKMLIQSEKAAALGRFSLGVAHEIKNPLGIILGGIEYLRMKLPALNDELSTTLKKTEEATLRADNIVHGLLKFARPAGLNLERLKPEDLIVETVSLLKYRAPLKDIKIKTRFSREELFIEVDRNQVEQVIFNILINAVEAMPKGGDIVISTYKAARPDLLGGKPVCVIETVDSGPGISKENLARLFEPFYTTKRDRKGIGLGLSISKTIVNNNKGELLINSAVGKGADVKIIFPLAQK